MCILTRASRPLQDASTAHLVLTASERSAASGRPTADGVRTSSSSGPAGMPSSSITSTENGASLELPPAVGKDSGIRKVVPGDDRAATRIDIGHLLGVPPERRQYRLSLPQIRPRRGACQRNEWPGTTMRVEGDTARWAPDHPGSMIGCTTATAGHPAGAPAPPGAAPGCECGVCRPAACARWGGRPSLPPPPRAPPPPPGSRPLPPLCRAGPPRGPP